MVFEEFKFNEEDRSLSTELGERLIDESQEFHITEIIVRHLNLVAEKIADSVEEED